MEILRNWDGAAELDSTGTAISVLSMEPVIRAQMFGNPIPDIGEIFVERAHQLKEKYGRVDVPWHEINRLIRGKESLPVAGGPDTLRCIYGHWNGEYLRAVAGDCFIVMVTWDADGAVHSNAIHQYGSATINAESPHYADQAHLFVKEEFRPVWLDYEELMKNKQVEYRPGDEVWQ